MPNRSVLGPATEAGQHGSVRLFGKCKHIYNRAVSKVTNVQQVDVGSSQLLTEEYYECCTNNFFSKGTMDSVWTDRDVHCLIDIWADEEIQTLLESAKTYFSKVSLKK